MLLRSRYGYAATTYTSRCLSDTAAVSLSFATQPHCVCATKDTVSGA